MMDETNRGKQGNIRGISVHGNIGKMDTLIGIAGQFYKTLPGAFKKKHTHTYKHDPLILL